VATHSRVAGQAADAVVLDAYDHRWRAFADAHPDRLPAHGPAWLDTLAEAYGFRPFVLAVTAPSGSLEAGIPVMEVRDPFRGRRWIGLPFTDCCPPLATSAGAAVRLTEGLARAAADAGIRRVEVRAPLSGWGQSTVATLQQLDLSPGSEAVQRSFSSLARRNIRKARRDGVALRHAESVDDLIEVYYRLHLRTRRRLGVPIQPRRFFRSLWRHMLEPGLGELLLASADGVPIAGAVFLRAGRTVVYKYGASDERGWRLRPNNLLMAEAIRRAAEEGYSTFDFGRTDVAHTGLRSFKLGWGATEHALVYSRLDGHRASSGPSGGRLLAGIIRRSPARVCRMIGERLYRYAA
jgi:CelD/BcsL family acetyltransferase involved in cellulose biosynthesis